MKSIVQNAYVVKNLRVAIEKWSDSLGLGPFYAVENSRFNCIYRGQGSQLELSVAMAQSGPLNIELIEQINDVPSVYRDIYPKGGEGFHHICLFTDNLEADKTHYRSLGYEIAFEGDMGVYKFCYVDSFSSMGHMIELVEDTPEIRGVYEKVRKGAETWQGGELVLPLY